MPDVHVPRRHGGDADPVYTVRHAPPVPETATGTHTPATPALDRRQHRAAAVPTRDVRGIRHPGDRRVRPAVGALRAQLEAAQAVDAAVAPGEVRPAQPRLSAGRAFGP